MGADHNFISDKNGTPIVFYHATLKEISNGRFHPFSHFGSKVAAHDCWEKMYDSDFGVQIWPVYLKVNNPIRTVDRSAGDPDSYENFLFEKAGASLEDVHKAMQPVFKRPILIEAFNRCVQDEELYYEEEFDCFPEPEDVKKMNPSDLIMPMDINDVIAELRSDGLFIPRDVESLPDPRTYDAIKGLARQHQMKLKRAERFGEPYDKKDPSIFDISERTVQSSYRSWLSKQRKAALLQKLGYDGLVYKNDHEDSGNDCYVILNPDQVVSIFEVD